MNRIEGFPILRGALPVALILIAACTALHAQSIKVETALSKEIAGVGEPVQFTVTVRGAQAAEVPRNFTVDGLQVIYRGQSSSINIINFQISATSTYTFLIIPEREGIFRIPSLAVSVDGKTYKTAEKVLEVRGRGTVSPGRSPQIQQPFMPQMPQLPGMPQNPFRPPGAPPPPSSVDEPDQVPVDRVAFAKLLIPQGEVFVGQVIPVEIKIFLDSRFRFNLNQLPTFSGEGFTAEKLSDPIERTEVIDGIQYNVVTFRSAITPVKAGTVEVGPARLNCEVIVQGGRGNSLLQDFFGGIDPFAHMFGESRPLEIKSNSMKLAVKALPREGRPAGFGGAIGNFKLDVTARPARAQIGEPIKLVISVSGEGNFNAIQQPEILPDPAWRIYSGGDQFVPADRNGLSGTKTFEVTIMATRETNQTPKVEFSYFDPVAQKYITLTGGPEPVVIQGGKVAATPTPTPTPTLAATPGRDANASQSPSPNTEGSAESKPAASLDNVPVIFSQWRPGSFVPMLHRKEFLIANAAALFALVCLGLYLGYEAYNRSSGGNLRAARTAQARLLRELGNPKVDAHHFYETAVKFLRGQMQLHKRDWNSQPDPYSLLDDPSLPEPLRSEIASILRTYDELKYSTVASSLDATRRENVLSVLRDFQKLRA